MGQKKLHKGTDGAGNADAFMRQLAERMETCPDAESLNDNVIIPFAAALENVCGARGYVLNIYGETSNIIFSGDPDDAEALEKATLAISLLVMVAKNGILVGGKTTDQSHP